MQTTNNLQLPKILITKVFKYLQHHYEDNSDNRFKVYKLITLLSRDFRNSKFTFQYQIDCEPLLQSFSSPILNSENFEINLTLNSSRTSWYDEYQQKKYNLVPLVRALTLKRDDSGKDFDLLNDYSKYDKLEQLTMSIFNSDKFDTLETFPLDVKTLKSFTILKLDNLNASLLYRLFSKFKQLHSITIKGVDRTHVIVESLESLSLLDNLTVLHLDFVIVKTSSLIELMATTKSIHTLKLTYLILDLVSNRPYDLVVEQLGTSRTIVNFEMTTTQPQSQMESTSLANCLNQNTVLKSFKYEGKMIYRKSTKIFNHTIEYLEISPKFEYENIFNFWCGACSTELKTFEMHGSTFNTKDPIQRFPHLTIKTLIYTFYISWDNLISVISLSLPTLSSIVIINKQRFGADSYESLIESLQANQYIQSLEFQHQAVPITQLTQLIKTSIPHLSNLLLHTHVLSSTYIDTTVPNALAYNQYIQYFSYEYKINTWASDVFKLVILFVDKCKHIKSIQLNAPMIMESEVKYSNTSRMELYNLYKRTLLENIHHLDTIKIINISSIAGDPPNVIPLPNEYQIFQDLLNRNFLNKPN
ncbi:hypothetical protein DLAC_08399 [Tieghemostelium lacteum]|uniref:Uncharacterized protein n=1 Tax=Tieghemostelium lacteum TaxID=361077 RepID=A0A151ZBV5_TIELA|nr:hypothetical protein DLAC_08399 [Tieghemostelium lacteum]|eukprot:KYQ91433.1 hypothetical protein DLAC_08399 [Tieghemostelium lacteum]